MGCLLSITGSAVSTRVAPWFGPLLSHRAELLLGAGVGCRQSGGERGGEGAQQYTKGPHEDKADGVWLLLRPQRHFKSNPAAVGRSP